jgi:drug/metabolite transporter (DMT)-like permease
VLLVPVILAVGNLYRTLRWPDGARPEQLTVGTMIASSAMLAMTGLLTAIPLRIPTGSPVPLLLIGAQTAAFSIQFLLFFVLQKRGGPVYLSLLGSVAAVVGVPFAIVLLGEPPLRGLVPAALLIGTGVALVARGGMRRRRLPVLADRMAEAREEQACPSHG